MPAALVQWQGFYWLVDSDGFMLPEQYTRPELKATMLDNKGKLNLRVIQGVTHAPVLSGHLWPGDDLAAGLELVKLLAGRALNHSRSSTFPISMAATIRKPPRSC